MLAHLPPFLTIPRSRGTARRLSTRLVGTISLSSLVATTQIALHLLMWGSFPEGLKRTNVGRMPAKQLLLLLHTEGVEVSHSKLPSKRPATMKLTEVPRDSLLPTRRNR